MLSYLMVDILGLNRLGKQGGYFNDKTLEKCLSIVPVVVDGVEIVLDLERGGGYYGHS